MYGFQKIYATNKSYLQSNSYSLTKNIELRPINYNERSPQLTEISSSTETPVSG